MSWEDQGRQYHSWFGHGTAGGVGVRGATGDAIEDVASGALERLVGERRAEFARYLSRGGFAELGVLLPAWAGHSGLGGDAFRREVVGAGLNAGAADAAHRVGRAYAAGDLLGAGSELASVVGEGGPAWRYGVRWARDLVGEADDIARTRAIPGEGAVDDTFNSASGVQLAEVVIRPGLGVPGSLPREFTPGTRESDRRVHTDIGVLRSFWEWLFPALPKVQVGGGVSPGVGQSNETQQHGGDGDGEDGDGDGRRRREPKPTRPPDQLIRPEPGREGPGPGVAGGGGEATDHETSASRPPTGSLPIDQTPWSGIIRQSRKPSRLSQMRGFRFLRLAKSGWKIPTGHGPIMGQSIHLCRQANRLARLELIVKTGEASNGRNR